MQRVAGASVTVEDTVIGSIGTGLLVLLGIAPGDGEAQLDWMAKKITGLRIFADEARRMNRSVLDLGGGILVVSQFTLYGDCSKGRRPSFIHAAPPELAEPLYEKFCARVGALGVRDVQTGRFGASMVVELINDGPVTLILER